MYGNYFFIVHLPKEAYGYTN